MSGTGDMFVDLLIIDDRNMQVFDDLFGGLELFE